MARCDCIGFAVTLPGGWVTTGSATEVSVARGEKSTMDTEPMYSAEQIKVPPHLPDIMKAWTKEVIRSNPPNIYEFSAKYVAVERR